MLQKQLMLNKSTTDSRYFYFDVTTTFRPYSNFLSFSRIVKPAAPLESTRKGRSFELFKHYKNTCLWKVVYPWNSTETSFLAGPEVDSTIMHARLQENLSWKALHLRTAKRSCSQVSSLCATRITTTRCILKLFSCLVLSCGISLVSKSPSVAPIAPWALSAIDGLDLLEPHHPWVWFVWISGLGFLLLTLLCSFLWAILSNMALLLACTSCRWCLDSFHHSYCHYYCFHHL